MQPVRRTLQGAGLLTFLALGIPDGLLGVAWPDMRREQHQAADALSILLVCGTAAFFLSSSTSATLARRFGNRGLLIAASASAVLGATLVATSQHFVVTALGVAMLSGGSGAVDAVLSSLVSVFGPPRLMSVMHGTYAVGAAAAPLVISAWAGSAWRAVYLSVTLLYLVLIVCWYLLAVDGPRPEPRSRLRLRADVGHVRLTVVVLALLTFVAASGLEIAAAAWATVYIADGLHERSRVAGLGALAFWTALCLARLMTGGDIARASTWLLGGSFASVAGGIALWAVPNTPMAIAALAVLGAGSGPMLPMLTVQTPYRVGRGAAAHVIGWQLAAASIGSALVAGGIGLWVHHSGVHVIPCALALMAGVCTGLIIALDRQPWAGGRPARTAACAGPPDQRARDF